MGHTNSTPNLHLPQFIGSDKPTWLSDVNGAMLAIDTAYGTIEADASSAATAAAGAVTVAGAAQTAADAAATAAATAGTNASQALSTANNAASVALQASTDATSALDQLTGDVIASVTADGVKTYAQILEELLPIADLGELTKNSVLVTVDENNNESYCRLASKRAGVNALFSLTINGATGNLTTLTYKTQGNASTASALQASGTGNSVVDMSANVPASGFKFTIYK